MKNKNKFNKIAVIGLGYIGLPTAALFASKCKKVVGVDVNGTVVDTINAGQVHIIEHGLSELVHDLVSNGCLRASTLAENADAYLIAVPTPFKDGFLPDLSFVKSAAELIAPFLKCGDLVILESTSPVGATEKMASWMASCRPDLTFPQSHGEQSDIRVAHCPERVLPGRVLQELVENNRVIGGMTPRCSDEAVELYKLFVKGSCITTTARTAEMCKLVENSFRDVNIAFANELSIICDKQNIDIWELIRLANLHPRVNILEPGPGVGGHCIAVDPWFIVSANPNEARLIAVARSVNDDKPKFVMQKVAEALSKNPNAKIACLGLSFKADIDDLRESPALKIVSSLATAYNNQLLVVEPFISSLPDSLVGFDNVNLVDLAEAIKVAEIILLLVNHSLFREINRVFLKEKIVIDTRGGFNETSCN
jgi:UDP-N-acetyl-D-mannosaminuronic acid dehydrogenase